MNRHPADDTIKVWVKFPRGAVCKRVPWWMADKYIIRDAIADLGIIAPKAEDCTVERPGRNVEGD